MGRETVVIPADLSPRDGLRAVLGLATELAKLHASGRLHRAIGLSALSWDRTTCLPALNEPEPGNIEFGGPLADPETCPPELRGSRIVAVPRELEDARRVLTEHGALMPPERIDIYQAGTLLCRLATGKSIRAYLSSPATMSRVPRPVRVVIDRCVGYDESNRVETAQALIELLSATVEERGLSEDALAKSTVSETRIGTGAETRVNRRVVPFQKLGHFEIQEEIGRGGMGVVYRARDLSLDRTVALKVLSQRFASDPAFVRSFQAEASAAAKLAHPHIVPIYFIGEDAGRHFYAMQFVDGESLAERLHRVGRLSQEEVLAIVQQVLLGLGAAHRQGFVHRDIKPGNILLDRQNGLALLTDFGLACGLTATDEPGGQNVVMGTAEYMSPEQAQGEPVDARSDLYSVGVLLYQLLSGQTPFHADTPSSQLVYHVCEQPQPLRHVASGIDRRLAGIVDRLLEKRPAERFQNVDELLIALQQTATTGAIASPLSSTLSKVNATAKSSGDVRRPRVTRSAAILAGLLLVTAIWWTRSAPQAHTPVPLVRHADPVTALAFSPDGRFVVSGGGRSSSLKDAGDTSLRLWDAATGQLLRQSERLPFRPDKLVFVDDDQVAALSSAREGTGVLAVWQCQTGQLRPTQFDEPFAFHFDAAALGRDLLAVGNQGVIRLHAAGDGRFAPAATQLAKPLAPPVRAIAASLSVRRPRCFLATERNGRHVVLMHRRDSPQDELFLDGFAGPVIALAVNDEETILVTRSTERVSQDSEFVGDFVVAWEINTRKLLWRRGPYEPASRALSLGSRCSRLITIAEPTIGPASNTLQSAVVLELRDGREICRVQSGSSQLLAAVISPNGRLAAIGDAEGHVVFSRLP